MADTSVRSIRECRLNGAVNFFSIQLAYCLLLPLNKLNADEENRAIATSFASVYTPHFNLCAGSWSYLHILISAGSWRLLYDQQGHFFRRSVVNYGCMAFLPSH